MRTPLYDPNAPSRTVSITMNADLASKAVAAGINLSRTAEAAVAAAFREIEVARIRAEIAEATRLTDAFVAEHGLPFGDWTRADEDPLEDDAA